MKKTYLFLLCVLFSSSSFAQKIGILSAMPAELTDIQKQISKAKTKNGVTSGKIGKYSVVAMLSGIGKVNAASATQRLISEYHVDKIVFTGVAGGINPNYNIGDVVLSLQSFQHDFGHLSKKFVMHAVSTIPEIGIGKADESPIIDLDHEWKVETIKTFRTKSKEFSPKFKPITMANKEMYQPKLVEAGIIATGDQFIANDVKKNELKTHGADLVEMEGAAMAQVCVKNKTPCLIIRSISDKAGNEALVDYKSFFETVAQNNAQLVVYLLQEHVF